MKDLSDEGEICERYNPLRKFKKVPTGLETGRSGAPKSDPAKALPTFSALPSKDNTEKQKGPSKSAIPCLVPGCKEHHFVRYHRPTLPMEEQKRFIYEFKKRKS